MKGHVGGRIPSHELSKVTRTGKHVASVQKPSLRGVVYDGCSFRPVGGGVCRTEKGEVRVTSRRKKERKSSPGAPG